jgi:hypothetical protein
MDLAESEGMLAVACGSEGVHLVDASGPTLLGNWSGHVSARSVAVSGSRVAVAGWTEALILDASDPSLPTIVASETASHAAMAVALNGDLLAVADWRQSWLASIVGGDAPEVRAREAWATPGGSVLLFNDGPVPLWLGEPDQGTLTTTVLESGKSLSWAIPEDAVDVVRVATDDPDEPTFSLPVGGVAGLSIGDPAPLFIESDLSGAAWSLEALRGEVVFLGMFNEG